MTICPPICEAAYIDMDERTLLAWAKALGFEKGALCSAAPFERARQMVARQEPLTERRQLRFDPPADDRRIRSLAVLLWPYAPAKMPEEERLFVDRYYRASHAAYHAARELESKLLDAGRFAKANAPYPAKEAAVRAGLGRIGRNSLLITPEYGTRVVIILIATDIEIQKQAFDETLTAPACVDCGRCAAACPSGAITSDGMTHPERCLRNFMMEGVVMPEHLREKNGMRLLGCDICQRVCPMQPKWQTGEGADHTLDAFMTEDRERFSAAVAHLADEIGRNAARSQRVRAQAAICAGNSGNPAYLPALRSWTQSSFDAVREHALWAVSQIEAKNGGA